MKGLCCYYNFILWLALEILARHHLRAGQSVMYSIGYIDAYRSNDGLPQIMSIFFGSAFHR